MYVLDCEGRSVEGWPLQMGEVQAQVGGPRWGDLCADILGVRCHDLHRLHIAWKGWEGTCCNFTATGQDEGAVEAHQV